MERFCGVQDRSLELNMSRCVVECRGRCCEEQAKTKDARHFDAKGKKFSVSAVKDREYTSRKRYMDTI